MRVLSLGVASGMLLVGCSVGSGPQEGAGSSGVPSASATASASTSVDPTPSSTLTPAQQQAFEEATDVVMAYSQTITDLYSGARSQINDLDRYVTEPQLERERNAVSQGVARGVRSEPTGVQLVLVAADPVTVRLQAEPPSVVLWACIDATAVTDVLPDGTRKAGVRERAKYTVVQTGYLPEPGWAVQGVTGEPDPKDRAC
ncbi:MAG: hypothetical protein WCF36_16525 [Candidatus Nanopelagicales bacterium]